jgi:DNA-binding CsgD family transcriptional regulator
MSSLLKIAIIDRNVYFTMGLKKILGSYLKNEGIDYKFSNDNDISEANVIFHYFPFENSSCFCNSAQKPQSNEPNGKLFFSIYPSQRKSAKKLGSTCYLESGAIYQDISIVLFLEWISQAINQKKTVIDNNRHCPKKLTLLTHREKEILYLIRRQFGQQKIASYLGVSHKTVSNHTRTIIRKLGLNRKIELLNWIIKTYLPR